MERRIFFKDIQQQAVANQTVNLHAGLNAFLQTCFPFKDNQGTYLALAHNHRRAGDGTDNFFQFLFTDEKEMKIIGPGGVGKTRLMSAMIDDIMPRYHSSCALMGIEPLYEDVQMTATTNKAADGGYKIKGKSGNVLKTGAGIKQQMEASNFYTYSEFNIKKFTEMLLDLTVGKISMGERAVTISTGEWGMYEFSKALEYHSTLFTPTRENIRI